MQLPWYEPRHTTAGYILQILPIMATLMPPVLALRVPHPDADTLARTMMAIPRAAGMSLYNRVLLLPMEDDRAALS